MATEPTTYDELREAVIADGGVYHTTAGVLRDIQKAGRLGTTVRDTIVRRLGEHGLAVLPPDLPQYQEQSVIIYQTGGTVEQVVEAVAYPSEAAAKVLRGLATSNAQDILQQIRALVGQAN